MKNYTTVAQCKKLQSKKPLQHLKTYMKSPRVVGCLRRGGGREEEDVVTSESPI